MGTALSYRPSTDSQHEDHSAMLLLGAVVACAMAEDPEAKSEGYGKDLGGKYDGYFQYANVPSPYEYEFGYNRGNPAHFTSRYEQAKEGRFRTKVKWADAYSGYGEHYYEYNHAPYYHIAAKGAVKGVY